MTREEGRRAAILGAGPVGLEAALAAHDAGMRVTVYEAADRVAGNVRQWSHVRLFTPWSMNVSPRARRHLERAGLPVPSGDECPTGRQLVEELLEPLASLPWIAPGVRTGVRVRSVGREGLLKSDEIGTGERARRPFRLLLSDGAGEEWVEQADLVLDCTGTWQNPNPLGAGGIPAPGEAASEDRIIRTIPTRDALAELAGRRVLLVGAGHSAQTAARDLARLVERAPQTRVVWAVRSEEPTFGVVADDALPRRAELTRKAATLARDESPLETVRGATVQALEPGEDGVRVTLTTPEASRTLEVDRIISLTGAVGEHTLYRQLQVHECYATSGPMNLAAALLGSAGAGGDCLVQPAMGVETLRNPEPDFFILGSKSYGRNSAFLLRVGWEQVDQLFGHSSPAPLETA